MVNATPLWTDPEEEILKNFHLLRVYPNPFNPIATIRFYLAEGLSPMLIQIFDINGLPVETLVEGMIEPGTHEIHWDADRLASEIYFVELKSGDYQQTRKLALLR